MRLPKLGIGTSGITRTDTLRSIFNATLPLGVRLFDTAQYYGNETQLAAALKTELPANGLHRDDLLIVSKVDTYKMGYDKARASALKSVSLFGHIDLLLVHWPGVRGGDKEQVVKVQRGTWAALEELQREGCVRGIGVSNYTIEDLDNLLEYSTTGPPSIMQSELHPRCHNTVARDYCREKGIQYMGYMPLGRQDLLSRQLVVDIASKYGISPAQVLIKWSLQKGAITIPRSSDPGRIVENVRAWQDGLVLDEVDIALMDGLEDGHTYSWNPEDKVQHQNYG